MFPVAAAPVYMPTNRTIHLKMIKIVNFMLRLFFHNKKLEKKDMEKEPLLTANTYLFNRTLYVTHPEAKTL